jgi:hypothetical protein
METISKTANQIKNQKIAAFNGNFFVFHKAMMRAM